MKSFLAMTLMLLFALIIMPASAQRLSDQQVKERIIRESIASYPGNCPCPYNKARNGSNCGKRSAYSKPGGYSPKCYVSDVSARDVQSWRNHHQSR